MASLPHPPDAMTSEDGATEVMPWHHLNRMPAGYRSAWELFIDWCQTNAATPIPATSSTVLAFLHDCPAAPATQALRVRAITVAHTLTCQVAPERTTAILDVLRGRPRRPDPRILFPTGHVDRLLATLPVHGWTAGWFGRRDRALLALADTGVSYRTLARLTVGNVLWTSAGVAISPEDSDPIELAAGSDPTVCRPCALVLWIRALQLAVSGATITVARAVDHAKPLTPTSPHHCRQRPVAPVGEVPLLTVSDSWGHIDVQPTALSARTLSRLARFNGHWNHRQRPLPRLASQIPPPAEHDPPATPRLDPIDLGAAAARRHATVAALTPLTAVLNDLETAAEELERRTAALLATYG